jgi:hypothetical protein
MLAAQTVEIAYHESGFSGGNLGGGHTTVLAHGSVRIGSAAAAQLIDRVRALTGGRAAEVKSVAVAALPPPTAGHVHVTLPQVSDRRLQHGDLLHLRRD